MLGLIARRAGASCIAALLIVAATRIDSASAQTPLGTTVEDFFLRGTQPNSLTDNIAVHDQAGGNTNCLQCHNNTEGKIVRNWQGSLMAQAARDPLFYACLDVSNHTAPGSGDFCIRCHSPKAWLEGRSTPTDASALTEPDRDGVTCNFCHRLVDPANPPGEPAGDAAILAALVDGPPLNPGNGGYVVDPVDLRRGPFSDAQCGPFHSFAVSPFFTNAALCGTCHDVSNPAFKREPDGSYSLDTLDQRHPTENKADMVPVERTYSEWLNSAYAVPPGVPNNGRFGDLVQPYVGTCQDCHMPKTTGRACNYPAAPTRTDMPRHFLHGAGNWVIDAVLAKYGSAGSAELTYQEELALTDAKALNIDMLQRAATLDVSVEPDNTQLKVRVINETGHKLPSGYPEGRRMWLNVKFHDCTDAVIAESGHYDGATATLTLADAKVYEIEGGFDAAVAAATGLIPGPSFHFVLNNLILKDNRIPPRGFTNAAFLAAQAQPVVASYADGQYWDDTDYVIPPYAVYAEVELFYQSTSREYIEFLRDANPNSPPNRGTEAYDLWLASGRSAPISIAASGMADVAVAGDVDGSRALDAGDIPAFASVLLGLDSDPHHRCAADVDGVSGVDGRDVQAFVALLLGP